MTWWEKRAPSSSPNLSVFAVKSLRILRIFLPFLASPVFVHCAQFWWHQLLSWKWNHSYSMCVDSQHGVQWLFNGLPLIDCNVFELVLALLHLSVDTSSLRTEYAFRSNLPITFQSLLLHIMCATYSSRFGCHNLPKKSITGIIPFPREVPKVSHLLAQDRHWGIVWVPECLALRERR